MGRIKREGQSFMEWLDERVQNSPEAKAAYDEEYEMLLNQTIKSVETRQDEDIDEWARGLVIGTVDADD